MADKYVIFKAKDFNDERASWDDEQSYDAGCAFDNLADMVVPDAIVIRLQDVFAAPGLYTYANNIQNYIEMLEHFTPGTVDLPTGLIEQLEEVRDYFFDMANTASQSENKKLPD